jgi:hypothetical protein
MRYLAGVLRDVMFAIIAGQRQQMARFMKGTKCHAS